MSAIAAQPISTRRLTLMPLSTGHAGEMATVLADPELYTFTGGSPPTRQELRTLRTLGRRVPRPRRVLVQLGDPAPQPAMPGRHSSGDDQHRR